MRRKRRFKDTRELWTAVERVRDKLRDAGEEDAARRLSEAMTISAHPGEVWPATLDVLRDLLRERPPGLDVDAATTCADELNRWPDGPLVRTLKRVRSRFYQE